MKAVQNQRGAINILLIPVIMLSLLFIGAGAFGYWAYTERQDYKTNVDKKVTKAVAENKLVVQAEDAKKYAEAAKLPLKGYDGPEAYGSVHISYPKTWSAYVNVSNSGQPLEGYFNPDYVPSVSAQTSTFALRAQVTQQPYAQALAQFSGAIQLKKVTVTPYSLPKVPGVIGVRIEGQLTTKTQGTMILLPVRDKALKVWTEVAAYKPDFETNILPNLTFSP